MASLLLSIIQSRISTTGTFESTIPKRNHSVCKSNCFDIFPDIYNSLLLSNTILLNDVYTGSLSVVNRVCWKYILECTSSTAVTNM
uniref:Uncharacterized protein n=1 Tax=viral metagenome TaxID=1070528 RepID=A0A6C0BPP2_9ZZZZ